MGGGFGGCIICLVENIFAETFIRDILKKYEIQYGKTPDYYTMNIHEGAHMIT